MKNCPYILNRHLFLPFFRPYLPLIVGGYFFLLALFTGSLQAQNQIIYVDSAAAPGGNGTSWASAYHDLQDALAVGNYSAGDVVWVAKGTYYPTPTLDRDSSFQLRNQLALYGGFESGDSLFSQRDVTSNPTILSGDIGVKGLRLDNSYSVVSGFFANETAVLDGFTIRDGQADDVLGGWVNGGGVYNFSSPNCTGPTLANCIIRNNYAVFNGGGMYNLQNSPKVINCQFFNNRANEGGAVFNGDCAFSVFENCLFREDSAASFGGAIHIHKSAPQISGCRFEGNVSSIFGGAIYALNNANPLIVNCEFRGNLATQEGGGMRCALGSSPTLTNCLFSGNRSGGVGGGFSVVDLNSLPRIFSCTFADNLANQSAGLYHGFQGIPTLFNTIFYGNRSILPGAIYLQQLNTTGLTMIHCLIEGLPGNQGINCINQNPRFIAPGDPFFAPSTAGNYQVSTRSPAIDAGNLLWASNDTLDLDEDGNTSERIPFDLKGSPRVLNQDMDIGCYETFSLCVPLGANLINPDTTVICIGDTFNANPGSFLSYLWSDGSTDSVLRISNPGLYWVEVTDTSNCSQRDTFWVENAPLPSPQIVLLPTFSDTFCQGDFTVLRSTGLTQPNSSYTFLWSNGSNSSRPVYAFPDSIAWVEVTDQLGCVGRDSLFLTIHPLPQPELGADTVAACDGERIEIGTTMPFSSHQWFAGSSTLPGETQDSLTVLSPNLYHILVFDANGCQGRDTVFAEFYNRPTIDSIMPGQQVAICAGDSVQLDAGTFSSYQWSTLDTTAQITVGQGGIYEVIVENPRGCLDTASTEVLVNPLPLARIDTTGTTLICPNDSVVLTAHANQALQAYQWSNGATTPSITVTTADTFRVTVTDTNGCQSEAEIVTRTIPPLNPMIATILSSGAPVFCSGDTLELDATVSGAQSYRWSTSQTGPRIQVSQGGTYWVEVTGSSGCIESDTTQNIVQFLSPMPSITGGGQPLCSGDTVKLGVSPAYNNATFIWTGSVLADSLPVSTGGAYTVTVIDAIGCVGRDTLNVNQVPVPNLQIDTLPAGKASFCQGDSVVLDGGSFPTYLWSDGSQNRQLTVRNTGSYFLAVTDTNNCVGRDTVAITVFPNPVLQISVQDSNVFCAGDSAILDAGQHNSYLWSTGATTQQVVVKTAGSYQVVVSDGNACSTEDSLLIQVNPNPQPAFSPANPIVCLGDTTFLQTTQPYPQYLWTGGVSSSALGLTQAGTYQVTVTDSNGCQGVDSVVVNAFAKPLPVINTDTATTVCEGDSVQLCAGTGFVSYLWSNGATTACIQVGQSGTYWVEVTDSNGCPGRDSIEITILPNPRPQVTPFGRTDLCQGDSVLLAADTVYAFYNWNTGALTRSIVARSTGLYILQVTDTSGCQGIDSIEVTVGSSLAPNIQVSGGSTVICDGDSVNLLVGNYTTYRWGRGQDTTTRSRNSFLKVGQSGKYWVEVMGTNGCTGTDTVEITIIPSLTPTISPPAPVEICRGDSVVLDAGAFATYKWSNNQTTRRITVQNTGNYLVEVADSNGCIGITNRFVQVNPLPNQGITPSVPSTNFCDGDSVQLYGGNLSVYPSIVWSTGAMTDTITVRQSGLFSVTVTDSNGCQNRDSLQITFFPNPQPQITADGPLVVCIGDTLRLDAGSYSQYFWSTASSNRFLDLRQGGTYRVTVTDNNGCIGRDTIQVRSAFPPAVAIDPAGPIFICPGRNLSLDAGAYDRYNWTTGDTVQNIMVQVNDTMTFGVSVVDTNGCVGTDSVEVQPFAVDTVRIVPTPNTFVACASDSLILTATGNFSSYLWGPSNETSQQIQPAPSALPQVITVLATDANGCESNALEVVTVRPTTQASFSGLDSSYCASDTLTRPLTGLPGGGTFSGTGIVGGNGFKPSASGVGIFEISYAFTSANGCTDTARQAVTVFPAVASSSFTLPDTLCNNEAVAPLQASPAGGNFAGPGVVWTGSDYQLLPDSLGADSTYYITYNFGVQGQCDASVQDSFYVKPVVRGMMSTPNSKTEFCLFDPPISITSSPAGGLLSCATCGSGLLGNTFVPSQAGVGTHEITYVLFTGDCADTARLVLTVNPLPQVSIANVDTVFCENEAPVRLLGNPTGGSFFGGAYVQNGFFDPDSLFTTPGLNPVSYFYVDPVTGCSNLIAQDFIVNKLPVVQIFSPGLQAFCPDGNPISLNASPSGGFFSGMGMRDSNVFDPVLADTGVHEITYTFTDSNGCVNNGEISLNVVPINNMGFINLDSAYCQGTPSIDLLTRTTPTSGGIKSFFGPLISNNRVLVTQRPAGTYPVGYIYTDLSTPAQCKDTIYTQVRIDTIPQVSFLTADNQPLSNDFCFAGGLSTTLVGSPGQGGSSQFYGRGVKAPRLNPSVVYDPTLAGIGLDTVAYVFTDNNGCKDSVSQIVSVGVPPIADILGYEDTSIVSFCLGDTLSEVFVGDPAGGQFWRQPPDTNVYFPTGSFTTFRFNPLIFGAGSHPLQYIYDNGSPGCRDSAFLTAYIFDKQEVRFVGLKEGYCVTDSIDIILSATPDAGSIDYLVNGLSKAFFNPSVEGPGTHVVSFVYERFGCRDTFHQQVRVRDMPMAAIAGLGTDYCEDDSPVTLTAVPGGGSFLGPGMVAGQAIFNPASAPLGVPLSIQYAYADTFGCSDTARISTIVYPSPEASLTVTPDPFFLCLNEEVTLSDTAVGNFTYFWDINGQDTSFNRFVDFQFETPGLKRIKHALTRVVGGCSDTLESTLFINSLPEPLMTGDTLTYLGDPATFLNQSQEGLPFEWLFSDTMIFDTSPVEYLFSDTGLQVLSLVVVDPCDPVPGYGRLPDPGDYPARPGV
jgi:hypothetical protein